MRDAKNEYEVLSDEECKQILRDNLIASGEKPAEWAIHPLTSVYMMAVHVDSTIERNRRFHEEYGDEYPADGFFMSSGVKVTRTDEFGSIRNVWQGDAEGDLEDLKTWERLA